MSTKRKKYFRVYFESADEEDTVYCYITDAKDNMEAINKALEHWYVINDESWYGAVRCGAKPKFNFSGYTDMFVQVM